MSSCWATPLMQRHQLLPQPIGPRRIRPSTSRINGRLSRWALAISVASIIAGCGTSSSPTAGPPSGTPTTPGVTPTTPGVTPTATGPAVKTSPPTSPSPKRFANPAAVAKCRQAVAARAGVSASLKSQLDELCKKSATESPVQIRQAVGQLCANLIGSAPVPPGVDRRQLLAACKTL